MFIGNYVLRDLRLFYNYLIKNLEMLIKKYDDYTLEM